jgi:hypothetical protein
VERARRSSWILSAASCFSVPSRASLCAAGWLKSPRPASEVSFDLVDFYHNESRLFGGDTLKRDLTASAEVLDALTPGVRCK